MAVTVPDPPSSGMFVLRSIDGAVGWIETIPAPAPPNSTGEWAMLFMHGSYKWYPLTSIRGPAGTAGLRGVQGPGGSQGADGKDAPRVVVQLVQ